MSLKFPPKVKRSNSDSTEPEPVLGPRKRRKTAKAAILDEEDIVIAKEPIAENSVVHAAGSLEDTIVAARLSPPRQRSFDDVPGPSKKPAARATEVPAPRKRIKKKANLVVSDDEFDDVEEPKPKAGRARTEEQDDEFVPPSPPRRLTKNPRNEDEDVDEDDFVPRSPPMRKPSKKGAPGARGRPKGSGKGKGGGEIFVRDERKVVVPPAAVMEETIVATSVSVKVEAPKKRRKTAEPETEVVVTEETTIIVAQSDPAPASDAVDEPPPLPAAVTKIKRLPTIKKNKSLASTAPPSGVSTPARSTQVERPVAAMVGSKDLDLSNSDIYKDLFKSASASTVKVGLSRSEKEEERRKELARMRDEAKAARLFVRVRMRGQQLRTWTVASRVQTSEQLTTMAR